MKFDPIGDFHIPEGVKIDFVGGSGGLSVICKKMFLWRNSTLNDTLVGVNRSV